MTSALKTPAQFARHAASVVAGPRQQQYGDPVEGFSRIAAIWNGLIAGMGIAMSRPLDAHDVVTLHEGAKIGRRYTGPYNPDDYVDGSGLAACAGAVAGHYEELRLALDASADAAEAAELKRQSAARKRKPKKRGRR